MRKLTVLTDNDVETLKKVINDYRSRRGARIPLKSLPGLTRSSPSYIARQTSGSIPARSGSTPGSKTMDIIEVSYDLGSGNVILTDTLVNEVVYNLSPSLISQTYIPVYRGRTGLWMTERICTCEQLNGSNDYTECDGTWVTGGNGGLETSDSDAKILFDPILSPSNRWRAQVDVEVTTSSSGPRTWEVRLIGGNEDPGTGYCDGNGVYFTWGQDADGEYYILNGNQYPIDTTCGSPAGGPLNITRTLFMCWDGSTLTAGVGSTVYFQATSYSPTGDKFGFATGTLVNVSSVEFCNFSVKTASSCCAECVDHCCLGPLPAELIIEITLDTAFFDLFVSGFPGPGYCHGQCADINGTYYISVDDCGGGPSCHWSYSDSPAETATDNCFGSQPWSWRVEYAVITSSYGSRGILVDVISDEDRTNKVYLCRFWVATDDPCEDWSDWLNMTEYPSYGSSFNHCHGTARIKKA